MQSFRRRAVAGVLAACCAAQTAYSAQSVDAAGRQDPALLQIRVIEGEGAIHTVGSRSSQPLVIRVTDERGRPVAGASVSFRLPDEGPSGVFQTGLRTEVAMTGADGRVVLHGMIWDRIEGPAQVRITASKGEARSGAVSSQYVTGASESRRGRNTSAASASPQAGSSRGRWALLAILVGGAAAGGVAAMSRRGGQPNSPPVSAPPAVQQPSGPAVTVGAPSISIGLP